MLAGPVVTFQNSVMSTPVVTAKCGSTAFPERLVTWTLIDVTGALRAGAASTTCMVSGCGVTAAMPMQGRGGTNRPTIAGRDRVQEGSLISYAPAKSSRLVATSPATHSGMVSTQYPSCERVDAQNSSHGSTTAARPSLRKCSA